MPSGPRRRLRHHGLQLGTATTANYFASVCLRGQEITWRSIADMYPLLLHLWQTISASVVSSHARLSITGYDRVPGDGDCHSVNTAEASHTAQTSDIATQDIVTTGRIGACHKKCIAYCEIM